MVFKKKLDICEEKPKEPSKSHCDKCNRVAASIVALLTFVLLLSYVIYDSFNNQRVIIYDDDDDPNEFYNLPRTKLTLGTCTFDGCSVTCSNADSAEEIILMLQANETACVEIGLTLLSCDFIDGTIQKGWLDGIPFKITSLAIIDTNLFNIENHAFISPTFENLSVLQIDDSEITTLKRNSFRDMKLRSFIFGCSTKSKTITVEEFFLEGIDGSLESLQIHNCLENGIFLHHLTGTKSSFLPKLETLDLSANKLQFLTNNSFQNAPNLKSLALKGNALNKLDVNTFQFLETLEFLDLSSNELSTLEEGIFNSLKKCNACLLLSENAWYCDCALLWFQEFVLYYLAVNNSNLIRCNNFDYQPLEEVNLNCKTTTQSTIETTIPPPVERTLHITIKYTDLTRILLPNSEWSSSFHITPSPYQEIVFTFFGLYSDTGVYVLDISGDAKNFKLVWYNSNNLTDSVTVSDISGTIVMEGMKPQTMYSMCLVYATDKPVSALECMERKEEPETCNPPQNDDDEVRLVIGIACGVVLLTSVLTGIIVFFYIRKNPKLIAGNKRIIIVGSKTTQALVMPKGYNRDQKKTKLNNCFPDYLTPTPERPFGRKVVKIRTPSESSGLSGISYIGAELSSRKSRSSLEEKVTLENEQIQEHIYESLPTPQYCKYENKLLE